MWRVAAWVLLTASFLSMCALLIGLLPAFTFYEYVPVLLGGLGVAAFLIHDDRKGKHRE